MMKLWIALAVVLIWPATLRAMDHAQAVKLSRNYLDASDTDERAKLAGALAEYRGDIQAVVDALRNRDYPAVKTGFIPEEHFSAELHEKHPDDLLYFNVPEGYRPDRPTGLIIFMHGGGRRTPREHPRLFMNFPEGGKIADDGDPRQIGDVLAATGMISVGPSAPWDVTSPSRWCVESADEYLADVIAECKRRFNIDDDRVFLIGHSMGGFGAFHHMQRQPDRFAGIVAAAGSWRFAYLPAVRGTKLCVIQAVHDAQKGIRPHFTDIAYGRQTSKLLAEQQIDHVYLEHDGEHAISHSRQDIAKFFQSAVGLRRDAYAPHIALASPVGFKASCVFPVEHNRWLTLDEAGEGEFEVDELYNSGGQEFDEWKLSHRKTKREGATIEAVNRGDNSFNVTTENVRRFTLWLHPRMVDLEKPVAIVVNGEERHRAKATPSLVTALDSYLRRGDWGLVYPMKIEVDVGG